MSSRPLRFLSLDGGGIRGYSELLILEAILQRVQGLQNLPDMPLPADYFDLIGGTSAGGLIAIMLGKLHMSVKDAKETFRALSSEIFKQRNFMWQLRDAKYSEEVFTSMIQDLIQRKLNDQNARLRSAREEACKVFVCSVSSTGVTPETRLFRSYESPWNCEHDCAIWEAARATAAAPTYYSPIKIGVPGREDSFLDGGLGCNNPIQQLHYEAENLFDPNQEVDCIISLGTGQRKVNELLESQKVGVCMIPIDLIKSLKRLALDSEIESMNMDIKYRGADGIYYRFNVEHGLEDVKLYDFEQLGCVEAQTHAYIGYPKVRDQLDQVAAILAGQGRVRKRAYVLGYLSSSIETVIATTLRQYPDLVPV